MQRIATLTALAAIAGAVAVALSGSFSPEAATQAAEGAAATAPVDRNAAGILAGALLGAAAALLSHALVATALTLSTEAAFKALTAGFFIKFVGAILPWAALTFLPPVGRLADPKAYVITFAIVVLLVLGAGIFDHLKAVTALSASTADKSPNEIAGRASDRASGSASSLPETPSGDSLRTPSSASLSPSVQPLGSGSPESAT